MTDTIRTLIVTGHTDMHHDWRTTTPALRALLERTGRFDVRITEEFRGATRETLEGYDLVILNYYGRDAPWETSVPERRWGRPAEDAIVGHVESGGGLVIYHPTLAGGEDWPEFERLAGGVTRPDRSRRAPIPNFRVTIADVEHPITAGMPPSLPHYEDDIFVNLKWQPNGSYRILATGWDNPMRYSQVPSQWRCLPGMGEDHPLIWITEPGRGRVFTSGLGHSTISLENPGFATLLARGAEWAGSSRVTIAVPDGVDQPRSGADPWADELEARTRAWVEAQRA